MFSKHLFLSFLFSIIFFWNAFSQNNSPIAYYPFNNSPNDTIGGSNGIIHGSIESRADYQGVANSAYYFPRTFDSYISIPVTSKNSLDYSKDYSVSFWFDDYATLHQNGNLPKILFKSDSGISVQLFGDTIIFNAIPVTYAPTSQWSQLTCVHKSDTNKIYLNGALIKNQYVIPKGTAAINYVVGQNYAGTMDELKLYNAALSTEEVMQLYQGAVTAVAVSNNPLDIEGILLNSEIDQFKIYSVSGEKIADDHQYKTPADIQLPSGMYLIVFSSGGKEYRFKFLR